MDLVIKAAEKDLQYFVFSYCNTFENEYLSFLEEKEESD